MLRFITNFALLQQEMKRKDQTEKGKNTHYIHVVCCLPLYLVLFVTGSCFLPVVCGSTNQRKQMNEPWIPGSSELSLELGVGLLFQCLGSFLPIDLK